MTSGYRYMTYFSKSFLCFFLELISGQRTIATYIFKEVFVRFFFTLIETRNLIFIGFVLIFSYRLSVDRFISKNLQWKEQPASLVAILSFKTELGNRNLQTKIRICSIFQFPVPLFCFSGRVRHSLKISVWAKCENQSSGRTARVSLDWTHFQTHKTLHKSANSENVHMNASFCQAHFFKTVDHWMEWKLHFPERRNPCIRYARFVNLHASEAILEQ